MRGQVNAMLLFRFGSIFQQTTKTDKNALKITTVAYTIPEMFYLANILDQTRQA